MSPDNEHRPLAGKHVVVTRTPEHAAELTRALEGAGAEVLLLPLVQFAATKNTGALDAALRDLGSFDWLIFTSANAVRFFAKRGRELGLLLGVGSNVGNVGMQKHPRVAAVGPATARAAEAEGFSVDVIAAHHSGRELAAELAPLTRGARVLLPRSNRADDALPSLLRRVGAEVMDVVAYCTEQPPLADSSVLAEIRRGNADVIILASPSAFYVLADLLGAEVLQQIAERTALAAIGPTTAAAIREFGVPAPIEAQAATSASLVDAIRTHFRACETGAGVPLNAPARSFS